MPPAAALARLSRDRFLELVELWTQREVLAVFVVIFPAALIIEPLFVSVFPVHDEFVVPANDCHRLLIKLRLNRFWKITHAVPQASKRLPAFYKLIESMLIVVC